MDLMEEDILGDRIHDHWYYVAKGRALRMFLGNVRVNEVLDVGAGSGIFSQQLIQAGLCDAAVCVDPYYAQERTETFHGKPMRFVRSVADDGGNHDLVLMMDVLEHVPDDIALLKEYTHSLASGSRVLITVPAFQFMWSGHDVFLKHYRRYTIRDIERVARQAGMTPVKSRYFFAPLFPVLALVRVVKRLMLGGKVLSPQSELAVYPHWLNRLLIGIHDVERQSFFSVNRLFGLSIFCLCEKP